MHGRATKVAVSLPEDTFKEVERLRHQLGMARSTAVVAALRLWLRQKEEQELEERYVKGYQRKPEKPNEVEPLFRAGLSSFTPERW